jgi:nitrite reductase/ring-hydroxylating ferredoxin subunit
MLAIETIKTIPYPYETVLSQYFDYEHIEHVHPETLGKYRVVGGDGNRIVYEQTWPPGTFGWRTSLVEHVYEPPGEMWFIFLKGRHRGVQVHTELRAERERTIVQETYSIPGLPDWGWLRALLRPYVIAPVDRIWDEDLAVEVCRDGWPGIPGNHEEPPDRRDETGKSPSRTIPSGDLPAKGEACVVNLAGTEYVLRRTGGRLQAFENRCPHTGGPLSLGKVDGSTVVCPWHGARFELSTGRCLAGPARRGIERLSVTETEAGATLARNSDGAG